MSIWVALLLMFVPQDASAADAQTGLFKHGIWSGQCWRHAQQARQSIGGLCRVSSGQAGKLWIMIERRAGRLDIFASGACDDEIDPVTVPQAQLTSGDRVRIVGAAIDQAVARVNLACKTREAFTGEPEDLIALLAETDGLAAGGAQ